MRKLGHVIAILVLAYLYHLLNQWMFGDILTPELIEETMGWGWYILLNIGAGALMYLMVSSIIAERNTKRELARQIETYGQPVKILTMSDPVGMCTTYQLCGCGGFFAQTKDRELFCLKCDRNCGDGEFSRGASLGARFGFE